MIRIGIEIVVALLAVPVGADVLEDRAFEKLVCSQVVLVGKVTNVVPGTERAASLPARDKDSKVEYRVATVKIEMAIAGAEMVTHVRVAFTQPPKPNAKLPVQEMGPTIELVEGQRMLFYLVKHPTADFYIMPDVSPPADLTRDTGNKELAAVKGFSKVLAEPQKGLKSEKAEVRSTTAALLVIKYRATPYFVGKSKEVPVSSEESRLILKSLAEGDWNSKFDLEGLDPPCVMLAFNLLGLSEMDGWVAPKVKRIGEMNGAIKTAFLKWLDGPGKDYRIKQLVPKK